AFSKLLRQAIEEAEKLFDHPLKQYMLFCEFEEQVQNRRLSDIPDAFAGDRHAQAYFGVFKKVLPEALSVLDQQVQDKWVKIAFEIAQTVEVAVTEHSINPQNIEADIRKKLLPRMLQECKAVGGGIEHAKKIVEMVVQITRVGLNGT
ncbi:MAG: type I restriction endonuclease subunit R, partial [Plesiomonas sp.]